MHQTDPWHILGRLLLPLALLLALHAPCLAAEPLRVLAGTTQVEDILIDLGGGWLTTRTLIPGSACPGHSDVKASDVSFSQGATAVIIHDWQQGMPLVQSLLRSVPGGADKVRIAAASGNWMLPERQIAATSAVAKILAGVAPSKASAIDAKARSRMVRAKALAARLKERAAKMRLAGRRVICDAMQRPLLEWLGFHVVAEYGRFEDMNPKQLAAIMTKAKAEKAVLVVDNMQSTGGSGKALAEDLGAAHVTLTNFPGVDPRAMTWEDALEWNMGQIAAALAARK